MWSPPCNAYNGKRENRQVPFTSNWDETRKERTDRFPLPATEVRREKREQTGSLYQQSRSDDKKREADRYRLSAIGVRRDKKETDRHVPSDSNWVRREKREQTRLLVKLNKDVWKRHPQMHNTTLVFLYYLLRRAMLRMKLKSVPWLIV